MRGEGLSQDLRHPQNRSGAHYSPTAKSGLPNSKGRPLLFEEKWGRPRNGLRSISILLQLTAVLKSYPIELVGEAKNVAKLRVIR